MKHILVKEIDRFKSSIDKNKSISEYLVYLMENDVKLACYSEIGDNDKNLLVNELILEHMGPKMVINGIIQEVSFEEFLKNQK